MTKKAVSNMSNKDNKCFMYSICTRLIENNRDNRRVSNYTSLTDKFDFSGLSWPTPITEIFDFENKNTASVNVYALDKENNV